MIIQAWTMQFAAEVDLKIPVRIVKKERFFRVLSCGVDIQHDECPGDHFSCVDSIYKKKPAQDYILKNE